MENSIIDPELRREKLRSEIARYAATAEMTDDERAEFLGLPPGCRMRERAKIISPENFSCGEYVWIGEGAILDASGGLEIGAHTSVGLNVFVWSHTSFLTNLAFKNEIGSPLLVRKVTRIGSGCFLGGPAVIYPGVTVGDQVVVLPMSTVTKDVPSRSIVAGSPARVIREISDDYLNELFESNGFQPTHG